MANDEADLKTIDEEYGVDPDPCPFCGGMTPGRGHLTLHRNDDTITRCQVGDVRELVRRLRRSRSIIAALEGVTEGARLPLKWVVDHADRAHEYDRPYAVEALRHVVAARDAARGYLRSTGPVSPETDQ